MPSSVSVRIRSGVKQPMMKNQCSCLLLGRLLGTRSRGRQRQMNVYRLSLGSLRCVCMDSDNVGKWYSEASGRCECMSVHT